MNKKLPFAFVLGTLSVLLFVLSFAIHRSSLVWGTFACDQTAIMLILLYYRDRYLEHKLHPEAEALRSEYCWSEHLQFDRSSWRDEVSANNTQLGYWYWVSSRLRDRDILRNSPFTLLD